MAQGPALQSLLHGAALGHHLELGKEQTLGPYLRPPDPGLTVQQDPPVRFICILTCAKQGSRRGALFSSFNWRSFSCICFSYWTTAKFSLEDFERELKGVWKSLLFGRQRVLLSVIAALTLSPLLTSCFHENQNFLWRGKGGRRKVTEIVDCLIFRKWKEGYWEDQTSNDNLSP